MRICSLLPSATEILYALGLSDQVVAVSHECDYPSETAAKPRVTTSLLDPETLSSAEIDERVAQALNRGTLLYQVDMDLLRRLQPDALVTQDLCSVCAVEGGRVRQAAVLLDPPPRVISLEPNSIRDMLDSIRTLADLAGAAPRAQRLIESLQARAEAVRRATELLPRPSVLCLEWLDPAWIAGHWVPELVQMTGGRDALAAAGAPSRRATWTEIVEAAPDVVILMPCGFDVERTVQNASVLAAIPEVWRLAAFQSGRVYAVNGSAYYSRAGPRLIDGLELMGAMLHPETFPTSIAAEDARKLIAPRAGAPELRFEN